MSEADGSRSWQEELASIVEETGVRYRVEGIEMNRDDFESFSAFSEGFGIAGDVEPESFKDQVKGFVHASAELLQSLAKGCSDIVRQNVINDDSFFVKKMAGPWAVVSSRLRFLNEYLPEDKDPLYAWPIVVFVLFIALTVLFITRERQILPPPRKVIIGPPSALRVQLPNGRQVSYSEQGVSADKARFSIIVIHSFLSSRFAGIPGIEPSLLEQFGVRLLTYDLPGFGESDPHPQRTLNSSAIDLMNIADALGVKGKFWVVGHSTGGMHAWAALRYIPEKVAGAALFAPLSNPYDWRMSKQEKYKIWSGWSRRRKFMYFLARRFCFLLPYFYSRSFLSGRHGHPAEWMYMSLGKKDRTLMEESHFIELWEKDFTESIRQGSPRPFVEEAALQASDWSFSLVDVQVHVKNQMKGFFLWLKSVYSTPSGELAGYLGPIHIWQGTDDHVVPVAMMEYVQRLVPGAVVHWLTNEGHFSYFYFCDECHRHVFLTLFGAPQGPLHQTVAETSEEETEISKVEVESASFDNY